MTEFASRHWVAGDRPLRRDIRLLAWQLRRVVCRDGRGALWDRLRDLRVLAVGRREGHAEADARLVERVRSLPAAELLEVVRALGLFFDLVNAAEDCQRARVLRQRRAAGTSTESLQEAFVTLRGQGVGEEALGRLADRLEVELVLTAHPTEAKLVTVRRLLRSLRGDLHRLEGRPPRGARRRRTLSRLRRDLTALWYTDPLRPRRPSVLEELGRGLYAMRTLWRVVPVLAEDLRQAAELRPPARPASAIRFGDWIGADRDGNPLVTCEVTRRTLERLARTAVHLHLQQCRRLRARMPFCEERLGRSAELARHLEQARRQWHDLAQRLDAMHPGELQRQCLAMIEYRLRRTWPLRSGGDAPGGYGRAGDLAEDLRILAGSLREHGLEEAADAEVRPWQDRVASFGLHLMRPDVRENSEVLRRVVAELTTKLGLAGAWDSLEEPQRVQILAGEAPGVRRQGFDSIDWDPRTRDLVDLFELLQRHAAARGRETLGTLIVSMTHRPSDALAMLWLSRLGARLAGGNGGYEAMPIVPLFETIDDLHRAGGMLEALLAIPAYRRHVGQCGDRQVCMIGYSDSSKDGGYVAANWALYRGQAELAKVARAHGVELVIFHGRGGALGRGGGPAARAIRALPPDSLKGRIRMTEQGEVIAERFDDPTIAHRHLEQVLWATILLTMEQRPGPRPEWVEVMDRMALAAQRAYRDLVGAEGFVDYFRQATPIRFIERMPIASRPSRRSGRQSLADLRAIPYTFAWTQTRQLVNAFYGLGAAWRSLDPLDRGTLGAMYREWEFFRAVIDNAEMALAKCEPGIARHYADLAGGPAAAAIYERFATEYRSACEALQAITGRSGLLEAIPWLRRAVLVRNPYVDILNLVQVELMRRWSEAGGDGEPAGPEVLEQGLRLTIHAIAAGLRNTG